MDRSILLKLNELLFEMTIDQAKLILAHNEHRFGKIEKIRKLENGEKIDRKTQKFISNRLNVIVDKDNKITKVIGIG